MAAQQTPGAGKDRDDDVFLSLPLAFRRPPPVPSLSSRPSASSIVVRDHGDDKLEQQPPPCFDFLRAMENTTAAANAVDQQQQQHHQQHFPSDQQLSLPNSSTHAIIHNRDQQSFGQLTHSDRGDADQVAVQENPSLLPCEQQQQQPKQEQQQQKIITGAHDHHLNHHRRQQQQRKITNDDYNNNIDGGNVSVEIRGKDYSNRPRPYAWASNRPAVILSLKELNSRGIHTITGTVACKFCDHRMEMGYNLVEEFGKLSRFIVKNSWKLCNCAPKEWIHPQLPACPSCEKPNSMKPVIADRKRNVNWLFMLLGKSLGSLSLKHLKHFCKHHNIHRTGAKNRVLYYTYLILCKQLDPNPDGRFDIHH